LWVKKSLDYQAVSSKSTAKTLSSKLKIESSYSIVTNPPLGQIRSTKFLKENDVAADLQGNTLRVYWALLKTQNNSMGPRDIQRKLGFSSPNLAVYHLDKLVELGLAEKISGEYHLTRTVDVGVLKQFTKLGGIIVPRHILYASMWTTLLVFFLSQVKTINFYSLFALVFGFLGAGILWFETWRNWRTKPV